MEIQTLNDISKISKIGLFICWLGLSYTIGMQLIDVPKLNIIETIAYLANQLDIFSNLKGGQPHDPTDFVL
jgi:hypothetical protein